MLYNKIPSLLGVFVLVLGLAAGVYLIGQQQIFRLGATTDAAPTDLRISNVTDTSFTASWVTSRDVVGYISWGETASLGQIARPTDTSPSRIHSVTVQNLSPGKSYFFVVNSGRAEFDNNGVPWSVQTGPSLGAATSTALASGRVVDSNGAPAANVLVYLNSGSIAQLSTTTSLNGTWTIPLSTARNKILTAYANPSPDTVLEIFIQGENGVATAQVLVSQANPIPDTALGHTYDFRDNAVGGTNGLPEANINLPEGADEQENLGPGSLDLSGDGMTKDTETVTLESITEPGEVIFTTTPEFFGEGPPNTEITITVESDPITDEFVVSSNGRWRWSPPTDLEEGEHKITISWRDAEGFLRTLTRTFIVQAAEGEPSFESTPSGSTSTPSPTPTPTKSPTSSPTATPISTPSPTSTATATPSPTIAPTPTPTRASIPSTESGMPVAGSLTPTLLLGSIGLLLFISGIVISKRNI